MNTLVGVCRKLKMDQYPKIYRAASINVYGNGCILIGSTLPTDPIPFNLIDTHKRGSGGHD